MQCHVLGPVQATGPGGAVALGGGKQRTLFALLVARAGEVVPVDRLVDELWGEDPPEKALASVQSYVANLRRALAPAGGGKQFLVTRRPGYLLDLDPGNVDATEFEELIGAARLCLDDDPHRARSLLERAEALWRGGAYADVAAAPTLAAESTRLGELRALAREEGWRAELALGAHERVIGELESFVAAEPLRESVWGLLALALYRSGRQADSLAALARARTVLGDELGIDPGRDLQRLEHRILRQDSDLDVSPFVPVPAPAGERLLGRAAELERLQSLLDEAVAGRGSAILLTGEPGIGKSTLATALTATAGARGLRTGWGGADDSRSAPTLWSLSLAIGDLLTGLEGDVRARPGDADVLTTLLPDLASGATPSSVYDLDTESFRLARALSSVLTEVVGPCVLVLDDIQWVDDPTLRTLRALLPLLARVPAVVVAIARDTETTSPLLSALVADLTRLSPRIHLDGLGDADIEEFSERHAGVVPAPEIVAALRDQTAGNPFYLGELVTALAERDGLHDPARIADLDVPDGVRDVVRARLRTLPAGVETFLATAAIVGHRFDYTIVGSAADLSPAVVADTAQSARANGFVVAVGSEGAAFRHALVRQAIESGQPVQERRRLHARVAAALAAAPVADSSTRDSAVAHHYSEAGPDFVTLAARAATVAAEAAEGRAAFDEARQMYEIAVAADELDPESDNGYRLRVALARVQKRCGNEREAWRNAHLAAQAALDAGRVVDAAEAAVTVSADAIWSWREYREVDFAAISLFDKLVDSIPHEQAALRANLHAALAAELYYWPEQSDRAVALSDLAVDLARAHGAASDLARILELRHVAIERPATLADRLQTSAELVSIAETRYDEVGLSRALIFRGRDRVEAGDFAAGAADYDRAGRIARRLEFAPVLVILAWWEAARSIAAGRFTDAAAAIERAAELHGRTSLPGADAIPLLITSSLHIARGTVDQAAGYFAEVAAATGLGLLEDLRDLALGEGTAGASPPPDYVWLVHQSVRARLIAAHGSAAAAAELEAELLPYAGRIAIGGTGICVLGTVDHDLGLLARARGDLGTAIDRFRTALDLEIESGLHAYAAATLTELARTLRQRGNGADGDEAAEFTTRARAMAERTGQSLSG
ncbi:AAA family ATPase [Aldersonia sp. NBC_00410]|uniref:BTAD domain-containing putative transcriptional regulator n=1 Tax=Aldersonia sp. NBC_00410 TaxID=2975954 RepID=UPI00224E09F0|nr:BTAD domain-containing putative transcriptional regulator [Aldersonia sp. NBC_00410]MCX5045859.1 AAA family ATPase [Aldersonia sp. NBC_00410]